MSETIDQPADVPPHRYAAATAAGIEARWQDWWEEHGTFHAPNPVGPLSEPGDSPRAELAKRPKLYAMDMFPYPSGAGLHVGHPLGYIATDVYTRYKRMTGYNVLHPMGFDAFGLPAEQYAVQTGQHPRKTTEENIEIYRGQLRRLGMAYDSRRTFATIDTDYYRWTQWIFLQIFNSWYDTEQDRARPITELEAEYAQGKRTPPDGRGWCELTRAQQREIIDGHRLAYVSEAPVNWCPGMGTVLSNEEVTPDGRSERGNFPVFRKNLSQWMMRITAYADRLLDGLDGLDWPESIKAAQRNWIGRSQGAYIDFPIGSSGPAEATADGGAAPPAGGGQPGGAERSGEGIRVFTTRPDTVFGATYMVLAPEHPLVDKLVAGLGSGQGGSLSSDAWPDGVPEVWTGGAASPAEAIAAYRVEAGRKSELERQTEGRQKTGVFAGAYAVNPLTDARIPIFVADYVLMGYGTGAIMAVPGQDERDWEFAERFELPIVRTVRPPDGFDGEAYTGEGPAINSASEKLSLDGLGVADAKRTIIEWLERTGTGEGTIQYKLRDWLFSRQRYWGEPFPIVHDEYGPVAVPEGMLPVELPEVTDYSPTTYDPDDSDTEPAPPLAKAADWVEVKLDLGEGTKAYRRETNTMPNWAGSCWYELRYLDPTNAERLVAPENERYWMGPQSESDPGGVDLYVGGQEHAVLHLLYARFWHKVLYDLGHVSSAEPFRRLINQGMIQAYVYRDERGFPVPAAEVVESSPGNYTWQGQPVRKELGKIGKSLKNVVTPDQICATYGADTFRVYEMSMGPLEMSRPWETRAVVGSYRFLQRVWRNVVDEATGECRVVDRPVDEETTRLLHRVVDAVRTDLDGLRFNTAIAKLIELNNRLTQIATRRIGGRPEGRGGREQRGTPREIAEPLVLMTAPFAPHLAEELWRRMGHEDSLAYAEFPVADQELVKGETVVYPVQINGKVRGRIEIDLDADAAAVEAAALSEEKVAAFIADRTPRKVIVVPGRMVSVVL